MRHCNRCGFTGDEIRFVTGRRYKNGIRPLCLKCAALYNKEHRKSSYSILKPYKPRTVNINIAEAINILINKGYARNEEEARRYIGA